jgi:hypothetical protein
MKKEDVKTLYCGARKRFVLLKALRLLLLVS